MVPDHGLGELGGAWESLSKVELRRGSCMQCDDTNAALPCRPLPSATMSLLSVPRECLPGYSTWPKVFPPFSHQNSLFLK